MLTDELDLKVPLSYQFQHLSDAAGIHLMQKKGKQILNDNDAKPWWNQQQLRYGTNLEMRDYIPKNGYLPVKLISRLNSRIDRSFKIINEFEPPLTKRRRIIAPRIERQVEEDFEYVRKHSTLLFNERQQLELMKNKFGFQNRSIQALPMDKTIADIAIETFEKQDRVQRMLGTLDLNSIAGMSALNQYNRNRGNAQRRLERENQASGNSNARGGNILGRRQRQRAGGEIRPGQAALSDNEEAKNASEENKNEYVPWEFAMRSVFRGDKVQRTTAADTGIQQDLQMFGMRNFTTDTSLIQSLQDSKKSIAETMENFDFSERSSAIIGAAMQQQRNEQFDEYVDRLYRISNGLDLQELNDAAIAATRYAGDRNSLIPQEYLSAIASGLPKKEIFDMMERSKRQANGGDAPERSSLEDDDDEKFQDAQDEQIFPSHTQRAKQVMNFLTDKTRNIFSTVTGKVTGFVDSINDAKEAQQRGATDQLNMAAPKDIAGEGQVPNMDAQQIQKQQVTQETIAQEKSQLVAMPAIITQVPLIADKDDQKLLNSDFAQVQHQNIVMMDEEEEKKAAVVEDTKQLQESIQQNKQQVQLPASPEQQQQQQIDANMAPVNVDVNESIDQMLSHLSSEDKSTFSKQHQDILGLSKSILESTYNRPEDFKGNFRPYAHDLDIYNAKYFEKGDKSLQSIERLIKMSGNYNRFPDQRYAIFEQSNVNNAYDVAKKFAGNNTDLANVIVNDKNFIAEIQKSHEAYQNSIKFLKENPYTNHDDYMMQHADQIMAIENPKFVHFDPQPIISKYLTTKILKSRGIDVNYGDVGADRKEFPGEENTKYNDVPSVVNPQYAAMFLRDLNKQLQATHKQKEAQLVETNKKALQAATNISAAVLDKKQFKEPEEEEVKVNPKTARLQQIQKDIEPLRQDIGYDTTISSEGTKKIYEEVQETGNVGKFKFIKNADEIVKRADMKSKIFEQFVEIHFDKDEMEKFEHYVALATGELDANKKGNRTNLLNRKKALQETLLQQFNIKEEMTAAQVKKAKTDLEAFIGRKGKDITEKRVKKVMTALYKKFAKIDAAEGIAAKVQDGFAEFYS